MPYNISMKKIIKFYFNQYNNSSLFGRFILFPFALIVGILYILDPNILKDI